MVMFLNDNEDSDSSFHTIKQILDKIVRDHHIAGKEAASIVECCLDILSRAYFKSSDVERRYLRKLSRTYILLFMLKNDPRVLEYFRNMTSNFNLYIGTDLIVRALSEHMLAEEDQVIKNSLKLLSSAGSALILTDQTLNEVWHHLITTHKEFMNYYKIHEEYMTPILVESIHKILIRAFFNAKFERTSAGRRRINWSQYMGQFLTVNNISQESARDELREYLVNEFRFLFESEEESLKGIDAGQVEALASRIRERRSQSDRDAASEEILSRNAATTVFRVYQRRLEDGERFGGNPYGFKTWVVDSTNKNYGCHLRFG